ncbi:hypothetical protein IJ541_08425 [bacterium]|nr:hypothetical protein [bacterium]
MKKIFAVIFILISVSCCFAQESDTNWQKVAENNYINPDGIVNIENFKYSFLLKAYNKGQYEPMYGKKIWYTLSQYTLDCSEKTYKIGVIDSYGYEDNFINGDYNRYADFQPIVQGSAVGEVAKFLCK